jgi:hypothetical protein
MNIEPVTDAMIEAVRKDGSHRKATMSDTNGKFALRGLSDGLTKFSSRVRKPDPLRNGRPRRGSLLRPRGLQLQHGRIRWEQYAVSESHEGRPEALANGVGPAHEPDAVIFDRSRVCVTIKCCRPNGLRGN